MDKKLINYYEILGVEPSADLTAVATSAKAKAQQINQAFRTLNDPQQRENYNIRLDSSATSENFYTILGITVNTAAELIKPAAQAKAIEVDKAFRILKDPEKRQLYDQLMAQSTRQQRRTKRYVNTVGHVSPRESPLKRLFAQLVDNFSTFETPSMQDIVIFVLASLFFLYMVRLFLKSF